ncbi:MAG: glycosyltransferase family 4 protein [Nitrosomonadales bacterium]|nr:glycosyltransferase family 4 protein [Nitrosomonadales bacterium]
MSTHTVRWINQISDQDFDVHLFPVNYLPVHPELRNVTVHQPWSVVSPRLLIKNALLNLAGSSNSANSGSSQYPNGLTFRSIYPIPVLLRMLPYLNGIKRVSLGESDATAPAAYGPRVLARLIRKLKPDLIHSLEFQHCGYNVLRAKEIIGNGFPAWLATNWGSDIYYYRQFEKHKSQISRLLRNADYYSCECERDVALAKELGFSGTVMPVMPNTGGLDISLVRRLRNLHQTSKRKIIMVKGYQHFAGRALTALDAVELCADDLRDYKIVVFSASPEIHERVKELGDFAGLDMVLLHHVNHEYMLRMFSRARVYLGVSVSDAISTSMLEAMAMGAFPIQTNTSCCNEWIKDGESGYEIPVDDVQVIVDRLREAARNDELVDRAAEINWETVQQRLDQSVLKQKAIKFYDSIFEAGPTKIQ